MHKQKSIFQNILAKGTLNIFNLIVPFLLVPYIYRVLNPHIMGNIEYALTLYSYFGLLGALGIYNYGLREISRYRENKDKVREIYKNLFVTGLISNFVFYIVFVVFTNLFIHDSMLRTIMNISGLALLAQAISVEWINEAYEDFKFITLKTIIIRTVNLVLIFLLVKNPNDYLSYVWIITLYWFFNYGVSYIYARKYVKISFKELFSNLELKKFIVPLFYILILNNTMILYTVADRTMLGTFTGTDQVAYYSVGQKIIEMIKLLLLSAVYVTLPRFSFYLEQDYSSYVKGIQKIMRMVVMIVLPVSIGVFMLSEEIVLLFAGKQYIEAIPPLRIFSLRIIIISIEAILYNQIIFLHRKEKLLVILNLICGGMNVLLNFFFINNFTPTIAIATTLFTEVLFQIGCFWYINKKLHISTGIMNKKNLKYLFTALFFIPVILLIKLCIYNSYLYLVCAIIICSLLYVGMLILTKDEIYFDVKKRLTRN